MGSHRIRPSVLWSGAVVLAVFGLTFWGCKLVPRSQIEAPTMGLGPSPLVPGPPGTVVPPGPPPAEGGPAAAPPGPPAPPGPGEKVPPGEMAVPPETVTPKPTPPSAAPPSLVQELVASARPDVEAVSSILDGVDRNINEQRAREARDGVEEARTAMIVAMAELPSVLARQYLRRSVALARLGDIDGAKKAIDSAVVLAGQLNLTTSLLDISRSADQAITQLDKKEIDSAASILVALTGNIQPSDSERLARRVLAHLEGIERALDMGSMKVAAAELAEAKSALWSIKDLLR